jgi:hypothetical protein
MVQNEDVKRRKRKTRKIKMRKRLEEEGRERRRDGVNRKKYGENNTHELTST